MKVTKFICDKCGKEITGVVYSLTCYAKLVPGENSVEHIEEVADQNKRLCASRSEVHLCRECRDEITDGVFIV